MTAGRLLWLATSNLPSTLVDLSQILGVPYSSFNVVYRYIVKMNLGAIMALMY